MSGRGGHVASVPGGGWQPVERIEASQPTLVRFVTERTGSQKLFDFSSFPVPAGLQRWFARAFARRTGPRSGVKATGCADNYFATLRAFARWLAGADRPPSGPQELTAAHMTAFRLRHGATPAGAELVVQLRSVLRADPELPEPARKALLARPPRRARAVRPAAYDECEWRLITTALHADVRRARDRIRAGRRLLADYRAERLPAGSAEARLGSLLEVFDSTGDIPRYANGPMTVRVSRAGGVAAVTSMLCLTLQEMAAFCLLLCALTGENFSTVAAWPAVHYQPAGRTGDAPPPVVLVEQAKARRGPEREHMVVALEDVPPSLGDLLDGGDEGGQLRSPLAVYRLLIELTGTSRRLGGHRLAHSAYTPKRSTSSHHWVEGVAPGHVWSWAHSHGFPSSGDGQEPPRPSVEVRRLRQTVIERDRRPVSHTPTTMNDRYLATSPNVQAESRVVVGDALRDELGKARAQQAAQVLTSVFVAEADRDLDGAAERAGLAPALLAGLVDGDHDTVLAACTGHRAPPGGQAGQLCTASFLGCLDCPNARALPRHLPVQLLMADRLTELGAHLDPAVWRARYGPRLGQLQEILGQHTAAERAKAREATTPEQVALVDDVLAGRWDLR